MTRPEPLHTRFAPGAEPRLDATRERLLVRFGPVAQAWWERLPVTLAALAERWDVVVGDAVGRGNTSLVLRCRRAGGAAAILKLTPDPRLAAAEAAALRCWESSGRVPQVWGHDHGAGALLLEAIAGEVPLADRGAPVALRDIAALIGALHRATPPAASAPPLAERVEFIYTYWARRRPTLARGIERAHAVARALAAEPGPAVLLHGDLHPGNVLDGGAARGLVAIDPRPCIGDAAFDTADWVFWGEDDPRAWEPRSRELAAALGLEPRRVWGWCRAIAPLLAASRGDGALQ